MNDVATQAIDFEAAALAHAEWKLKLTHYIFGEGKLDAAVVCRDDQCLFGRWVHGPGKAHEAHPRFAPLREAHARFHREAAKVVELVDNRDVAQARRLIADDSVYVAVSKEVISGLFALKDDLQRARERALVRLEQAVRGASVPLVITDPQLVITFANDAAERMMTMHEAVLQQSLRGFSAATLVGTNIAVFFDDAGTLQRVLATADRTAHRAELKFGPLTFRTTVTAVHDERGQTAGATMEWSDVTVQVDAEGQLQRVLAAAADGSLNERIDVSRMEGFVKTMGESINGLLTVIAEPVAQTSRVVRAMADGDFTVAATGSFKGAFGDMVRDLDMCRDNLRSAVARIRDAAALIAQGASELNDGNSNLSNRTQQQAAALEETTATVTAMASHLRQSAEAARGVSDLAAKARTVAADGGDVVSRATVAMSEIKGSSARIADIIGVIDEIAFQTNLLALNAAVEAARAGDQGRGFAVVASEVRSLAQRSATAAKEIKGLIKDSVAKVELGTRLVDQSGTTLKDIVDNSKRVSDMVATIASSSDQQATNIDHVEKAVTEMDEMTQQNAALVEEAAAASSAMDSQARQLDEIVGGFRVTDDDAAAPRPRRRKSERLQQRREEARSGPSRSAVPQNVRPLRPTGLDRRR